MEKGRMGKNRLLTLGFVVLATMSLTGTQCVVVGSSGGNTSDNDAGLVIVVRSGSLDAPRVSGLRYTTGGREGYTGAGGGFDFSPGATVGFRIGDLDLGRPVAARERLTVLDLVPAGSPDSAEVVNLTRFLLSLDSEPDDDDSVTVPRQVDQIARLSNPDLAGLIRSLDFADRDSFDSVAANLLAQVTEGYGFTVSLVDADSARARLERDLGS